MHPRVKAVLLIVAFSLALFATVVAAHNALNPPPTKAARIESIMASYCEEVRRWDAAVPRSISGSRGDTSEATIEYFRQSTRRYLERAREQYNWHNPC